MTKRPSSKGAVFDGRSLHPPPPSTYPLRKSKVENTGDVALEAAGAVLQDLHRRH